MSFVAETQPIYLSRSSLILYTEENFYIFLNKVLFIVWRKTEFTENFKTPNSLNLLLFFLHEEKKSIINYDYSQKQYQRILLRITAVFPSLFCVSTVVRDRTLCKRELVTKNKLKLIQFSCIFYTSKKKWWGFPYSFVFNLFNRLMSFNTFYLNCVRF